MPPNVKNLKNNRGYGEYGEDIAERFLKSLGYKIISKNFRTSFGEIDIIAKDANFLVFVEVKTRSSEKFGKPEESVGIAKLRKIRKVADFYLQKINFSGGKVRLEVVAITTRPNEAPIIKLIKAD